MIIEVTVEKLKKHRKNPIRLWIGNYICNLTNEEARILLDGLERAIDESLMQERAWCIEAIERKTK